MRSEVHSDVSIEAESPCSSPCEAEDSTDLFGASFSAHRPSAVPTGRGEQLERHQALQREVMIAFSAALTFSPLPDAHRRIAQRRAERVMALLELSRDERSLPALWRKVGKLLISRTEHTPLFAEEIGRKAWQIFRTDLSDPLPDVSAWLMLLGRSEGVQDALAMRYREHLLERHVLDAEPSESASLPTYPHRD